MRVPLVGLLACRLVGNLCGDGNDGDEEEKGISTTFPLYSGVLAPDR